MGLIPSHTPGQTPVDVEEMEGLKINTVTTQGELNDFEQLNNEQALIWVMKNHFKPTKILTETFVKKVHQKMFSEVWRWAGKFRTTNKSLGVDKFDIVVELRKLLGDINFWIENRVFEEDEIAIRFKHRLVSIHCFNNGNGRHSRLMADIIIKDVFNRPVFSWGHEKLVNTGEARKTYLKAIKAADKGDYTQLIKFARS
jgi:Fic-DOC domain mobile mystery protein B